MYNKIATQLGSLWDAVGCLLPRFRCQCERKQKKSETLYRPFSKWTVVLDKNFSNAVLALLPIIPLLVCTKDISAHMSYLGVNSRRGQRSTTLITENEITLTRAKLTEVEKENMTNCPKQRRELTVDWSGRKNHFWTYPLHQAAKQSRVTENAEKIQCSHVKINFWNSSVFSALVQVCHLFVFYYCFM